jgi:predicted molibdopterin-dependent oxidoreductase YjgC
MEIIFEIARRLGHDWGKPVAEKVWDELRGLSSWHTGMSYKRLEELNGIHWPCPSEDHPGSQFLHARLWQDPVVGPRAPFHSVEHDPPVDLLTEEYPIRLTTGRRLDSFNTGVQTANYRSPLRRGESIDMHADDARDLGVRDGEIVRVISRRGAIEAPVRLDQTLRPGLAFMTFHFQDEVASNIITIDATDPKSGTAEFKATAIRIEKLTGPSK